MDAPREELGEGIDRGWLREVARVDPVRHAFAVWDLEHSPGRVRFVSLRRDGATVAYLLVWYGGLAFPLVHWVSDGPGDDGLLLGLPAPPVVAVVPERQARRVEERLGARPGAPIDLLVHPGTAVPASGGTARPVGPGDRAALLEFVAQNPGAELEAYAVADPDLGPAWAAWDGPRVVAVTRAEVRLPAVWVLTGVFTRPSNRGRGYGRDVVAAATGAALAAGAQPALYVGAGNAAAERLYRSLGYVARERPVWVDGGTGRAP